MKLPTDCTQIIDAHQLIREGTSQEQRRLDALKPVYVQVDEHQPADWMVFAQRYAEYVRFYDLNNTMSGDWRTFFTQDPSAIMAVAAVQKVDFLKTNISGYFKVLLSQNANNADLKKNLGHAFNILGTLAWQLELLKEALPKDIALKGILQNIIQLELAQAFERLIAYFKAANNVIDINSNDYDWEILGGKIGQFPELYKNTFSSDWYQHFGETKTNWEDFHQQIKANDTIFGGSFLTDTSEKLHYAAGHNLFTGIFDLFIKAYSRVVTEANKSLEKTFTGKNDHEPHYALFLAFLRLFEFVRDHANTLTTRHLDFYYEEVLRLKEKLAEPNHAHLILQLAKHQQSHLLKAGTEFNAGKDSKGNAVTYLLNEDFAANNAKVVALKSVNHTPDKLYAFPVSNSDDGRGAELTSPIKQWHPFTGKIEPENLAQVGFAIASHYLLLNEGQRKIMLNLSFDANSGNEKISQQDFCQAFDFFLTGKKGWVQAKLDINLSLTPSFTVKVPLLFDGNQPPIIPLKSDIHGNGLPEGLPTLKVVLKQDNTGQVNLNRLQKTMLDTAQCSIEVSVGYENFSINKPEETGTGLKNLSITNQFGDVKPDKPFQPFGPMPETGDYLIVGSDEVFQKKNARFQFRVVWKGLPDWRGDIDLDWVNEFAPNISLSLLKNGIWNTLNTNVQVFYGARPDIYFPSNKMLLPAEYTTEIHFDQQSYTLEHRNGFVKMTLSGDFGHKLYLPTLSRYLIRVAQNPAFVPSDKDDLRNLVYKKDESGKYVPINPYTFKEDFVEHFSKAPPIEPYTPVIESLTLSYTASVKLTEENTRLFWLMPFGYKPADLTKSSLELMPAFNTEGEFYIGIKDLNPPQNLSLLFQLAEGSANPTVTKPENHVQWSYLKNNEWVDFKKTELSDATGQLTRSGIIRYAIPKESSKNDTLFLSPNTYWLRAVVVKLPDAVCKIITVTAQAALVTFKNQDNATDFLSVQLAKGSISKLVIPEAAIKKTEQPYPTFGGRQKEASENFYTRVSERLRHKNRAISAWDYEHLILEAFPYIYKVKCLNHMHLKPRDNGGCSIHNELAPGHITIVTIPNLSNHNAIDPLQPNTNLGDLDLIKKFMARQVSCFVELHVHNPIFEIVRVDFKVKFFPGKDAALHRQLLQQELVRFLSPWAFAEGKDVTFGGKIYKSSLIDFVEEQDYVDYVTDFQLFHPTQNSDGTIIDGTDLEKVKASTAISILVSVAADKHTIQIIPESASTDQDQLCQCQTMKCE
ncbi:hypothetical protein [Methylobacter sp. S3L5C]|uniref:hypothetical protein n=1 Tax=Methylobacter sp. S3L5C TaxID=2839024 RepID=UPI001FAE2410|nr:hypothetical protein [Methylobacter sp. S3L5C]UOA09432.1 hypothetical protein KKZ03_03805 [Methylobacter sp. S3L5C]